MDVDIKMMSRALELAALGDPSPNPHVGCVIAAKDRIIAEGYHQSAGMAHAEMLALQQAGSSASGKTLYTTLEPCTHEDRDSALYRSHHPSWYS